MYKFIIRKPISPSYASFHKRFLLSFLLIVVFGLTLNARLQDKIQENYQLAGGDLQASLGSVQGAYIEILNNSDKSAEILLFEGINLMEKNQGELGLLALEKAVEKDPHWRDSALYTGYSYLRLAEEFPRYKTQETKEKIQNSKFKIQNSKVKLKSQKDGYLLKAKSYLEKARDLDPLYSKTHELLAIVYQKLGDSQNAQLSLKKVEDFNK